MHKIGQQVQDATFKFTMQKAGSCLTEQDAKLSHFEHFVYENIYNLFITLIRLFWSYDANATFFNQSIKYLLSLEEDKSQIVNLI